MWTAPFKGILNVHGNAGLACTAGNALLPILSDIVKPKIARAWNHNRSEVCRNCDYSTKNVCNSYPYLIISRRLLDFQYRGIHMLRGDNKRGKKCNEMMKTK